jgi:hypothetical protein
MFIEERARAVGMLVSGSSLRQVVLSISFSIFHHFFYLHLRFFSLLQVARHFHRQLTTIKKLWAKINHTGSVQDIRQRPRSRVTTRGQDCYMILSHLRDSWKSAASTARQTNGVHGHPISSETVRNRLKEEQLFVSVQGNVWC